MKCHSCKEDKLSKEFPFYPLTEDCDHPLLHCLDCAVASVKTDNKCSQCESSVDEDNKRYKEYLKTLNFLFPNEEVILDQEDDSCSEMLPAEGEVTVITLSGEKATFPYHPQKKIFNLKKEVETEFKTPPEKQRLLYHDKELKIKDENSMELTLSDFNITPNSTLQLIVILCAVPEDLDELVFDFCWGLPPGKTRDYLDVSVFIYCGNSHIGTLFWYTTSLSSCPGVTHSGPADMDYTKREGHHRVNIALKSVPDHIDKIVFTLSAWASSTISEYPYRKLRFYDINFPDQDQCNDDMSNALHKESIIMCSLSRKRGTSGWGVVSLKCGADGCTKSFRYGNSPLQREIEQLIRRGYMNCN